MIDAQGISKLYGNFVAVDNVSFQIGKGEIVGLLGHNGAGKTTIMKMLTGYLEPTSGRVLIDGLEISESRLEIQSKIGYLPENCPVYRDMNVTEYLCYVCEMRGIVGAEQRKVVRDTIEQTQLREKSLSLISTLSKGFQQRVGVAQAIIHKPQILILDEPTNGLDPSQIHDMRALIRVLAQNSTIIISTHILQEVEAVCGRVIVVLQGKVALDSRLDHLQQSHRVQVTVDKPKEEFSAVVKSVPAVQKVTQLSTDGQANSYMLELTREDTRESMARVADVLVRAGVHLYELHPEKRDLEAVFREINAGRSV